MRLISFVNIAVVALPYFYESHKEIHRQGFTIDGICGKTNLPNTKWDDPGYMLIKRINFKLQVMEYICKSFST